MHEYLEDIIYLDKCREIYTEAIQYLGDEKLDQKVLVAFAKFEIKMKEVRLAILC